MSIPGAMNDIGVSGQLPTLRSFEELVVEIYGLKKPKGWNRISI